ncbi:MAG: ATP-grasp domain-containing protein [Muribaculaceae bacterium]|nr:ATP-grasp domain-containing protein [Muribaculaceae bacterium]
MKKAIVLAGGFDQIALIKELQSRGYYCILIDYFQSPPAKNVADQHIIGSTLDEEFVKKIASQEKADLIVTACTDQALLTMAKVSQQLGLPSYIDYSTALNVTNKSYMKDILLNHQIPTAKYLHISNEEDIDKISDLEFPLIVKPADCNSSKGVKKVDFAEELLPEIRNALKLSRSHTAIVEEFKQGRELSADLFIENGVAKLLSVTQSNKIPHNNGAFTIMQSQYPVSDDNLNEKITLIGQQIASAFNLKNTPLLIQLIHSDPELYVIEFSARMGGGTKYELIKQISGVDIMKEYVNLVLGDRVKIEPVLSKKYINLNYLYCRPGTLASFANFEENRNNATIEDFFLYKTPGMTFDKVENSGDRAAGVLLIADSSEELERKTKDYDNSLKVLDPSGNDLLIHNLIQ